MAQVALYGFYYTFSQGIQQRQVDSRLLTPNEEDNSVRVKGDPRGQWFTRFKSAKSAALVIAKDTIERKKHELRVLEAWSEGSCSEFDG